MTDTRSPAPADTHSPARAELFFFLEIFALSGFVVVQPLLHIVGGSPTFLIFYGLGAAEALLVAALLALVPPAVLWGAGLLIGLLNRPARLVAHRVTLVALLLALAIQVGKQVTPVRGALLVVLAVVAAGALLAGYLRWGPLRSLTRYAAVGPVVFAMLFMFASPAAPITLRDGAAVAGDTGSGDHPPIVMIVLDELPTTSLLDEQALIDAERFPNFARLADDSTWYRNATTMTGFTPYAMPSLLTGNMPADPVAPHHANFPDNLFTLFGADYPISAHESVTALCPPVRCGDGSDRGGLPAALSEIAGLMGQVLLPVDAGPAQQTDFAEETVADQSDAGAAEDSGVDLRDPEFMFERAHDNQPYRFAEFRDGLTSAEGPELHFLHLLLPHIPWTYLPSGIRYNDHPELPRLPEDDPWWGQLSTQRLNLQLEYTDILIGEVLDMLEQTGQYEDSLVVVTADHGIVLDPETSVISGGRQLAPEDDRGVEQLAWVPTFIKAPGQTEGVIDDGNLKVIDLVPTIADHAGTEVPWQTDGISWVQQEREDPEKTYVNTMDDRRVIDGDQVLDDLLTRPTELPDYPPPPNPELVGASVADLTVEEGEGAVQLAYPDHFRGVDPGTGMVPALVHGWASGMNLGTPLAIAINGEIGAVVPVAKDGVDRRFAGLVEDPSLFLPGVNMVEVFEVATDGETLRRLDVT